MTELIVELDENKFMLRLGENDDKSNLKIHDVTGKLEEFIIFLAIKNENDVKRLKKIFHAEGGSVKKLAWHFYSEYVMSAVDVVEMLNCFDKLEILELSSFDVKFSGDYSGMLYLPNIKSLKILYCDNFIIDFLTNTLPENLIPDLTINNVKDAEDKLCEFIKKQTAIKKLTLYNDLNTIEPFKILNLESLRCPIDHHGEKIVQQRKFLHNLIKSQINLKSLDLLSDSNYMFNFVNDEMFTDICNLSNLESLAINIESMTEDGIKAISNLSTLKTFKIETAFKNTTKIKTLKEFGAIQNSSIENLTLNLWFDIPDKIYREIGQNYQNLTSLTITHGTNQRFSLFAQAFPHLESLNIHLGEYYPLVTFDELYDEDDNVTLLKLRFLTMRLCGEVNVKLLFTMLSSFPILEKLEIDAKLPFTAFLINQFANNVKTIKSLKLLHFEVKNNETFPTKVIDALKLLRSKLKFVSVALLNTQTNFKEDKNFTYNPIIDELRDIYRLRERYFRNIRIYKKLILEAGQKEYCD